MSDCRALLVLVVVASCASDTVRDESIVARNFSEGAFCPAERTHATLVPELAMEPLPDALAHVEPWHEPAPPPEIASDPQRMQLWKQKVDADYDRWEDARDLSRPETNPIVASLRAIQIYEVTGCATTRLYACRATPVNTGRRSTLARACNPVDKIWWDVERGAHVVCLDGGAIRAAAAHDASPILSCSVGDRGLADFDLVAYRCTQRCPEQKACLQACTSKQPRQCEVECESNAAHCELGCATAAREQCEQQGLAAVGMCEHYADQEQQRQQVVKAIDDAEGALAPRFEAEGRLKVEEATLQTCSSRCTRAAQTCTKGAACSHEMVTCLLDCAKSSRERCEAFAPSPVWCDGFRAAERALREQR